MKSLFAFAILTCATGTVAYAADAPAVTKVAAAADDEASEAADENKMICRKSIATGSRLARKKTCMTQRDWNRLQDGAREGVDGFTRGGTAGAANSGT